MCSAVFRLQANAIDYLWRPESPDLKLSVLELELRHAEHAEVLAHANGSQRRLSLVERLLRHVVVGCAERALWTGIAPCEMLSGYRVVIHGAKY